jgi:hypothetical protein
MKAAVRRQLPVHIDWNRILQAEDNVHMLDVYVSRICGFLQGSKLTGWFAIK